MKDNLSNLIEEKRKKVGISQRELARRINIDNAYISKIEKGEIKKPSINILYKICTELKINFLQTLLDTYENNELEAIGFFNNINEAFNFINNETLEKVLIKDKNQNIRISLIKILELYKNNLLNEKETISLLSCLTNKNLFDYLTNSEINKLKAEKLTTY